MKPDIKMLIPYNRSWLRGTEIEYMAKVLIEIDTLGKGIFSKKVMHFFERRFFMKKSLLTKSCTAALELSSILIDIKPGDEVIIPSYTFVSTANAFMLRGARIVFADSESNSPNIDVSKLETLITSKTKAIIAVHYAGIACNMNEILKLAHKYNLFVIEDAAQSIDSFYNEMPLGTIGDMGAFSFHSTKNISCTEGGLLNINNEALSKRADIIFHMGTNQKAFYLGEVAKYEWTDIGSAFELSELLAAYLYAQLENIDHIQDCRKKTWNLYFHGLSSLQIKGLIRLPFIPTYATNNAHIFYIVCNLPIERTLLINYLKEHNIQASFHYQALHKSPFFSKFHDKRILANSDHYTDCLLRLPLYPDLSESQTEFIIQTIQKFFIT